MINLPSNLAPAPGRAQPPVGQAAAGSDPGDDPGFALLLAQALPLLPISRPGAVRATDSSDGAHTGAPEAAKDESPTADPDGPRHLSLPADRVTGAVTGRPPRVLELGALGAPSPGAGGDAPVPPDTERAAAAPGDHVVTLRVRPQGTDRAAVA